MSCEGGVRWVLNRPLHVSNYYDPEIQEPLGLEYLTAVLRGRGDEVLLLDGALCADSEQRLGRRAAAFEPQMVGLSLTTAAQVPGALRFYEACVGAAGSGEDRPAWIAGGNFVSTEPGQARRLLPQEVTLVRFEAEGVVQRLSRALAGGQGARTAGPAGELLEGAPVPDLDSLPFPHREFAAAVAAAGWALNMQGSRGCCGRCRYCGSSSVWGRAGRRWRGRSPEHIVTEMEQLVGRYGIRSFNFVDEDFLGPVEAAPARAEELARQIRQRRLDISFGIQARPSTLDRRSIRALARAGLAYVFLGIESDDPADFLRWRRPWTGAPWDTVASLRSAGVEVGAGVLLFHRHSTLEGIRRFAARLRQNDLLNYRTAINRLDAMPGSAYHRRCEEQGQVPPDHCGPLALEFRSDEVERLYGFLRRAVDPLGPPTMHAVCALPPLLGAARHDPEVERRVRALRQIITAGDEAVAATLFALLDSAAGTDAPPAAEPLRARNLELARALARRLVEGGFAPSLEQLLEAIRLDSGS